MVQFSMGASGMSDADWQKHLQNVEINAQREQQARNQAMKLGQSYYSWDGVDGSKGMSFLDNNSAKTSSLANNSSSNAGSSNTGTSNSGLFGNNNSAGGLFGSNFSLDDYTNKVKDLSNFQLGQNEKLGQFNLGLRSQEADGNFGRQYKLDQQQIQGNYDVNKMQQDATTGRLQSQLSNESQMQQKGFDQENLFRAQSAALAMRGLQ